MDKYNAQSIQDKWQERWEHDATFQYQAETDKPLYVVDTPPPYVSADHLHAGHIMSYAQAEFIVRYKRMQGFNVYYPMGFDDNGLPTERFVEKKYHIDKATISRSDFIKKCLEETEIGAETYKNLWSSLGISVDWSKTYSTISPIATKVSQWSILDLYKKGALYRKAEPILWCTTCETALAQADLEDEQLKGHLHYIDFSKGTDSITIATTRPELLGACVALYANPADKRYSPFIGQSVTVPLFDYQVPVLASDKVDPKFGTGIMMVCTWGDQEDVEKWREDKLEQRALLTENGHLNHLGGKYEGLKVLQAREQIVNDLYTGGFLKSQEPVERSVNVHERCSTPVEFVLSKQWFIKLTDLQEQWLKYGEELSWYPASRQKDYNLWVENLKWDWCISRQRFYGVPLPIWYCARCEQPMFADEAMLPVNPAEDKPPFDTCQSCGCSELLPEQDVMDTWATSSCSPLIIQELGGGQTAKPQTFPASLRPNAFEIIRTWDFYSIVKSHYHFGKLPFKDVMISGHGLDEQGKKFSKRLGNYIPADQLVKQYGADAIRYWATGAVLGQNLRFSVKEVDMGHKTAVKLWNVARLIKMQDASLGRNENIEYELADIWILDELNKAIAVATDGFENYAYAKARDAIEGFFWSKFTDYYIEFIKYRLFGDNPTSKAAALATLRHTFSIVLKLYTPIMPFITEELYNELLNEGSVHISTWPEVKPLERTVEIADFNKVIEATDEIRKYKSSQDYSLGKELAEYKLNVDVDLMKYGDMIAKVGRIECLT